MYIYGSECTVTLVRDKELTAVPYTMETLREIREETALEPLIGYMMPLAYISAGMGEVKVLGCVVTRVCLASLQPIASVLADKKRTPFSLLVDRVAEKRIYTGVRLTGFEVRAARDEALYVRLDVEGREAADWDYLTKSLPWEQTETLMFREGDIRLGGDCIAGVYRFALTWLSGTATTTILQLHYPLSDAPGVNNARGFGTVTLTFGDRIRCTLHTLTLLSFEANTDNAAEILVVRRYRVDGSCLFAVRNDKGEWVDLQ